MRRERLEAERQLRTRLERLLGGRLGTLTLTQNRTTLISAQWSKRTRGAIDVRLQGLFVRADEDTLRAVARICLGEAAESDHGRVRDYHSRLPPEALARGSARARRLVLRAQGRHHHLAEIQSDLLTQFDDLVPVAITWGRGARTRPQRRRTPSSVLLGSYTHEDRLIRIHPVLDRREVPHYVVESIVHHEMLHAVLLPEDCGNGRRRVHTAAFRRRERLYPHFERAEVWLDGNLGRLLRRFRA